MTAQRGTQPWSTPPGTGGPLRPGWREWPSPPKPAIAGPPDPSPSSPPQRATLIPSLLVAPAVPALPMAATLPPVATPLRAGASGPDMAAFQRRLASLSYMAGATSPAFGTAMTFAVTAFQEVTGLPLTGVIYATTRDAHATAVPPTPAYAAPPRHIEMDIAHQVLFEVDGGQVTATISVSTGTDKKFVEKGATRVAVTANGVFTVLWKYNGWWTSPLGQPYKPAFIDDKLGIAIHGYASVPNQPASHGCIRVPMVFADWMYASGSPRGTTVFVHGGPDGPNP